MTNPGTSAEQSSGTKAKKRPSVTIWLLLFIWIFFISMLILKENK